MIDNRYERLIRKIERWPTGYRQGVYNDRRYGVTLKKAINGRNTKLYAEALNDSDVISFNLFSLKDQSKLLKPCEMSSEKVIDFVINFKFDT